MDASIFFDEFGFMTKNEVVIISRVGDSDYEEYALIEREVNYSVHFRHCLMN